MEGFVYIIESPSDVDLMDGRTEGGMLREALRVMEIPHAYTLVTTRAALDEALHVRLAAAITKKKAPPILHFSMHGFKGGICLTDTNRLSWVELRDMMAPTMDYMEGNLLICMSTCYGLTGMQLSMHDQGQPFGALIGHHGSVPWADAAMAYSTFYHLFFKEYDLDECVRLMREASGNEGFEMVKGRFIQDLWRSFSDETRRQRMVQVLSESASPQAK